MLRLSWCPKSPITFQFSTFSPCASLKANLKLYLLGIFKDANIDRFKDYLLAKDWSNVLSSTDAQCSYNNFQEIFSKSYDLHLPLITKKFNKNFHKKEPWMTGGLLTSRRSKINLENGTLPAHQQILCNFSKTIETPTINC